MEEYREGGRERGTQRDKHYMKWFNGASLFFFFLYTTVLYQFSTHIIAINIAIRQHHGWVVLVHDLAGDFTHQARVCAVGHGKRLSQLVQGLAAYWTVWVFRGTILFVTLSVNQESREATYSSLLGERKNFSNVTNPYFIGKSKTSKRKNNET